VNLNRSVDQLAGRSLLLSANRASRPSWAPERLEIVVVPLETKAKEQNAAAMLSMLAPAHACGPAKGGALEAHMQVFEGLEELICRYELTDLFARVDWHDHSLIKAGCARYGGRHTCSYTFFLSLNRFFQLLLEKCRSKLFLRVCMLTLIVTTSKVNKSQEALSTHGFIFSSIQFSRTYQAKVRFFP